MAPDQEALVADPAKALLDLVYITPGGDSVDHLGSLRLDHLDAVVPDALRNHARRWGKDKITRAVRHVLAMTSHA